MSKNEDEELCFCGVPVDLCVCPLKAPLSIKVIDKKPVIDI